MKTLFYFTASKLFAPHLRNVLPGIRLSSTNCRVRFAPSPTGYMHLGGLRTALYNYLYARQNSGRFIFRIEDTDQSRLVPGAQEKIIEDLQWIGINIDEGPGIEGPYGPYIQSKRINIYLKHIKELIKSGQAYYCFCSEKRLNVLRKDAMRNRQIAKYDNRCRNIKLDEAQMRIRRGDPHCVRFKLTKDEDCCKFNDLIYGDIEYDVTQNEGDPIILKTDGFPTYHIANVIDDHYMNISHVLRGVEWQISTTKHLMMYKAFEWDPPEFGHLPLLVDSSGNKLSKRKEDTRISQYRESGIFPNALLTFVTSSGGGFIDDFEKGIKPKCYTLSQLKLRFNLGSLKSSPGKFDMDKLMEYNQMELENLIKNSEVLPELVRSVQKMVKLHFAGKPETTLQLNNDHVESVLKWTYNRIHKLSDLLSDEFLYLWVIPEPNSEFDDCDIGLVRDLVLALEQNRIYLNKQGINRFAHNLAEQYNTDFPKVMKLFRQLISEFQSGPSVADMLVMLGRDNAILRLRMFLEKNEQLLRQKSSRKTPLQWRKS